jgi:hypothetical protein
MRYRSLVLNTVAEIVRGPLGQAEAKRFIDRRSEDVKAADRARFVEMVETELLALHEGNIAPYKVLPTEFAAWRKAWARG